MNCFLYVTHKAWDFSVFWGVGFFLFVCFCFVWFGSGFFLFLGFFFFLNAFVIPFSLARRDDRLQRLRNCCWSKGAMRQRERAGPAGTCSPRAVREKHCCPLRG